MLSRFKTVTIVSALLVSACSRREPSAESPPGTATLAPAQQQQQSAPAQVAAAPSAQPSASPMEEDQTAASTATAAPEEASEKPERTPDVIYVPTPQPVVDKMLELAQVKKEDVVYDLGCGDGRIVVTAAKRFGTRAYGFDIDPVRIAEAKKNVRDNKVEHLVTIEKKDIFTLDLSPANVVTLYLLPQLNVKLIPQLQKLRPGSRIVSHDFDMKGVKPLTHLTINPPGTDREHEVYLWHTPLQKDTSISQR